MPTKLDKSDARFTVVCFAPYAATLVFVAAVVGALVTWLQGDLDEAALTVAAIMLPTVVVTWVARMLSNDLVAAACPDPAAHDQHANSGGNGAHSSTRR